MMMTPQSIRDLVGVLRHDGNANLSASTIRDITVLARDHRIEMSMWPHPRPSVEPVTVMPVDRGAGPKQLDLAAFFIDNPGAIIGAGGGNRSGKTESIWGMCFCRHIRDRAINGDLYWCIAPDFVKLRQGPHKWLWRFLPRAMFADRVYSEEQGFGTNPILQLTLPGGRGHCTIVFKTEEQDITSFESDMVSGIAWTEAQREAIYDAIQARIIDRNGFILIDYLPDQGWHRFRLQEDPHVHHVGFGMMDNAHNLPRGAIARARAGMSKDEAEVRIDGKNRAAFGVVYKQFDPEVHCVTPFTVPKKWPLYMWGDWGYRNPHAILLATVAPNESKFVIAEEYDNETTVFECCRRVWSIASSFRPMSCGEWEDEDAMFTALRVEANHSRIDDAGRPKRVQTPVADHIKHQWLTTLAEPCIMDASIFDRDQADGTALADEFERCGFPVQASIKANKTGGVELVRRHFEQMRLFFFSTCVYTRRDHASWRYKEGRDRIPDPEDRFERKHDHACLVGHTLVLILGRGWTTIADFGDAIAQVRTPFGWADAWLLDQGIKETWLVTFDDGSSVEGTDDHHLLSPLGWVTLGELERGATIYESESDFQCAAEIQRASLLPLREILSASADQANGGAIACRGVDLPLREAEAWAPHSPQGRQQVEQSNRQLGDEERIEARQGSLGEGGASGEGEGHEEADGVRPTQGGPVAQERRGQEGVGSSSGEVEADDPERAEGQKDMRDVWQEVPRERHLRLSQSLLRIGGVRPEGATPQTRRVVSKVYTGSKQVYDLSVPSVQCFMIEGRIISHNCAAVMYGLRANPTHSPAKGGIDSSED